jgi:hydroxymethylbilane synthase
MTEDFLPRRTFRFGTRGSALALAQTEIVLDHLRAGFPGINAEAVVVRTEGDIDRTSPLTVIGGRGVFTNALEAALLAGDIDAAVHSAKDLPSLLHPDAPIVAFPRRDDPRDAFVSHRGTTLAALPPRPTIGTSSRRREALVRRLRPDARIVSIRGNIDTRLRQAESSALDGIVVATAGLLRMGWGDRISQFFPIEEMPPAPGQGAIAVQARAGSELATLLAAIDDPAVSSPVQIERAFLAALGAGCAMPVGAIAMAVPGGFRLVAALGDDDGDQIAFVDEPLRPGDEERHAAEIALHMKAGPVRSVLVADQTADSAGVGLCGLRIVVTRPRAQAGPLIDLLRQCGADVLPLPVVRVEPVPDTRALDSALRDAQRGQCVWIVFTSANAVAVVARRLEALGIGPRTLSHVKIASIGAATAAAAVRAGLYTSVQPDSATAAALAKAVRGSATVGDRVLYPRSAIGRGELERTLRAAGLEVVALDVYETLAEQDIDIAALDRVRGGDVDVVTFSSPSSVRRLLDLLGPDRIVLDRLAIVCTGPVTAQAATEAGLSVAAVSDEPGPRGIAVAIGALQFGRDARSPLDTDISRLVGRSAQ